MAEWVRVPLGVLEPVRLFGVAKLSVSRGGFRVFAIDESRTLLYRGSAALEEDVGAEVEATVDAAELWEHLSVGGKEEAYLVALGEETVRFRSESGGYEFEIAPAEPLDVDRSLETRSIESGHGAILLGRLAGLARVKPRRVDDIVFYAEEDRLVADARREGVLGRQRFRVPAEVRGEPYGLYSPSMLLPVAKLTIAREEGFELTMGSRGEPLPLVISKEVEGVKREFMLAPKVVE